MADDYNIHLNFLATPSALPAFTIFRKRRDLTKDDRPDGFVSGYKLPNSSGDEKDWPAFWVSPTARPEFESFQAEARWNRELTTWLLYLGLRQSVTNCLKADQFWIPEKAFNIESLVNTLYELERNEEHPLYPFIAAWNARFASLAGERFTRVRDLRHRILELLKHWVCPDDPTEGSYYGGLIASQRVFTFPLRIFSLNYDLCVERLQSPQFVVENGFSGFGPKHIWSYERFIDIERGENPPPQAFLYKLHGSIDWKRHPQTKALSRVEQVHPIPPDEMEIIFGREAKLEAADPYLFYAYEFRQCALEAKVIVALGYSFSDSHINKIVSQALKADEPKVLIVISGHKSEAREQYQNELVTRLGVDSQRVRIESGTAKEFLSRADVGQALLDSVPQAESPF